MCIDAYYEWQGRIARIIFGPDSILALILLVKTVTIPNVKQEIIFRFNYSAKMQKFEPYTLPVVLTAMKCTTDPHNLAWTIKT